jgi:hypothetical protein
MPCGVDAPGTPTVIAPGRARASATNAATSWCGESAATASSEGTSESTPTGVTSAAV